MKNIFIICSIILIIISNYGCMSMMGMCGMHGNMSDQHTQNSIHSQKNTFQNDDLTLTLSVPVLISGASSDIEFDIAHKSDNYKKIAPRLIMAIEETGNSSTKTVEFDAEGVFPVEYVPQSTGFANITIRLFENESNKELMFVQQKINSNNNNSSFFSNPGTYIYGGLIMGGMMAVMIFTDWH